MRVFDGALGLQQAVEPARCARRFGQKHVGAVEMAHVPDPVRLENRLAAGDRQGMECADRAPAEFLQIRKMRRLVAIADTVEDAQMQFVELLHVVENPADMRRGGLSGEFFHTLVGHQEQVQLRPDAVDDIGQRGAVAFRRQRVGIVLHVTLDPVAQTLQVVV